MPTLLHGRPRCCSRGAGHTVFDGLRTVDKVVWLLISPHNSVIKVDGKGGKGDGEQVGSRWGIKAPKCRLQESPRRGLLRCYSRGIGLGALSKGRCSMLGDEFRLGGTNMTRISYFHARGAEGGEEKEEKKRAAIDVGRPGRQALKKLKPCWCQFSSLSKASYFNCTRRFWWDWSSQLFFSPSGCSIVCSTDDYVTSPDRGTPKSRVFF